MISNRQRLRASAVASAAVVFMTACGGGGSEGVSLPPVQTPLPSPPAIERLFTDVTSGSGIDFANDLAVDIGPGDLDRFALASVASGDYDNDGNIDLFIARSDGHPNLLYRNTGDLVFEDVANAAGIAFTRSGTENYRHSGPMFADIDGDGDLDLFVGGLGGDPSLVFANNGNGTFEDVTAGSGIDTMGATHSISAAFGDYDLDGDLDLFVSHWGTPRDLHVSPGDTEHLWRNDTEAAGIRFQSVSEPAGISPTIFTLPDELTTGVRIADTTFAPSFARINDDLYPDILSVADFNYSQYFVNNQDGTFSNATDTDVIIDGNGMGSAVADYDNDGDLDWFVTSIACGEEFGCSLGSGISERIGNRLYRNKNGAFEDATEEAGVASGGWGWGACFVDFENDGDLDIYHTNGFPDPNGIGNFESDTSRAFVAIGNGKFEEHASSLGLADIEQGRGVVCADFDNDGDVDILQLHRSSVVAATLWRNDTSSNNFLRVKLLGSPPNTEAAGARITIVFGEMTQMREISIASNFASQNPTMQIFGLGPAAQVGELKVEWPDGQNTTLINQQAGQLLTISHPDN